MRSFLFSILILFCFISNTFALSIISTFDTDMEGWSTDSGGTVFYEPSGGNPGGFLRIEDIGDDTYAVFPPAKFQGDLRAFNGGMLSYDFIVVEPKTPLTSVRSGFGRITIFGSGLNATFDYAPNPPVPSTEFWKTYYVPMTAEAWHTSETNWDAMLSDVSYGDFILQASQEVGLDNFRINPVVPEPTTLSIMGFGLLGLAIRGLRAKKNAQHFRRNS